MRALVNAVDDPERQPRSLTIHYARAPEPGPVELHATVERAGRSLSTLSARMLQDDRPVALALAAFSKPWAGPEIHDLPMPSVAPPDAERVSAPPVRERLPAFVRHLVMQPRLGGASDGPMDAGGWLGLAEPHALDAIALALLCDAWFSPPYVRMPAFVPTPTIDLTIHFRATLPTPGADPHELCLARFRTRHVHEGFFEEDGVIWSRDGEVLAQSRQLALMIPAR